MNVEALPPVSVQRKVAFYDCDPLGIVWHGNYFKYLEQAREALLGRFGLGVQDLIEAGTRLVIVDTRCRYQRPLRHGQSARITAQLRALEPVIEVTYTIVELDSGKRALRAWTKLALTDADGRLLTEIPHELRQKMVAVLDGLAAGGDAG